MHDNPANLKASENESVLCCMFSVTYPSAKFSVLQRNIGERREVSQIQLFFGGVGKPE